MVRGHGRGGSISRDCRMICYALCMHCMAFYCPQNLRIAATPASLAAGYSRLNVISRLTSGKQLPSKLPWGGAVTSLIHIEFQYSMSDTFVPYTPTLTYL